MANTQSQVDPGYGTARGTGEAGEGVVGCRWCWWVQRTRPNPHIEECAPVRAEDFIASRPMNVPLGGYRAKRTRRARCSAVDRTERQDFSRRGHARQHRGRQNEDGRGRLMTAGHRNFRRRAGRNVAPPRRSMQRARWGRGQDQGRDDGGDGLPTRHNAEAGVEARETAGVRYTLYQPRTSNGFTTTHAELDEAAAAKPGAARLRCQRTLSEAHLIHKSVAAAMIVWLRIRGPRREK